MSKIHFAPVQKEQVKGMFQVWAFPNGWAAYSQQPLSQEQCFWFSNRKNLKFLSFLEYKSGRNRT